MDRYMLRWKMLIIVLFSIIFFPALANASMSGTSSNGINSPLRIMTPAPQLLEKAIAQNRLENITEVYNKVAVRNKQDNVQPLPPGGAGMPKLKTAPLKASTPVLPSAKALAIAVQYSDKSATTDISYFQNLLFGEDFGTMHDYYETVSNDNFLVTGKVVGTSQDTVFITLPHEKNYYAQNSYGFDGVYPNNAQGLVADAVQALIDSNFDWTEYKNSEGLVPYLFVIHAGAGAESSDDPTDMWSCRWALNSHAIYIGDTVINDFTLEPELTVSYYYGFVPSTMGVYAHEFGHNLGLPDLYDINYQSAGAGDWSIMAGGSWAGPNHMGEVPVEFDAWSKIFLGWTTPEVVPDGTNVETIPQIEDSNGKVFKLNTQQANEYFLIENRQQDSYDYWMDGNGLLIWHIDSTIANPNSVYWYYYNTVNSTGPNSPPHHGVYVIEADGNGDLDHGYNRGDSGDPFPGSSDVRTVMGSGQNPNLSTWNSQDSGLSLADISDSATVMSATVTVEIPAPIQHELDGTVTDPTGNPIQAWIELYSDDFGYYNCTLSDENGVFSFDNIPVGSYYVLASSYYVSDYFNSIPQTVALDPALTEDIALALTTKEIEGQVKNPDNEVVSGSTVTLYNDEWYISRTSDEQGHYELGGLPGGEAYVVATPGCLDYAPKNPSKAGSVVRIDDQKAFKKAIAEAQKISKLAASNVFNSLPVKVNLVEGQVITQDISLTRAELTGTVRDPQQAAVKSWVYAYNWAVGYYTETETDDSGVYLIGGLPAGDYMIYAWPDGASEYFNSIPQTVTLDPSVTKTLDLNLSLAEIEGDVLNPDQSLAGGQDVFLYNDEYATYSSSDSNGHYKIGGLPTGYYYLQAFPNSPGFSVESILLGSAGGQKGVAQPVKDKDALAKALQEAAKAVAASGNVYQSFPIRVHIVEGQLLTQNVQFTGDELIGTVSDPSGTGLRSEIYLYSRDEQYSSYAYTDSDGNYAIGGLRAGEYEIIAYDYYGSGYYNSIPQIISLDPVSPKSLDLSLTTKEIEGLVLGTDGSQGGSTYVVIYNDEYYSGSYSDWQGNYQFGGFPTGDYLIYAASNFSYAAPAGVKSMVRPIEDKVAFAKAVAESQGGFSSIPIQVHIVEQQVLEQNLQLTAPEVTGHVTDPTGQAVSAYVEIFNNQGSAQMMADADGNYALGGLPSGSYTLIAYMDNDSSYYNSIPQTVIVERGIVKSIDLQLTTAELQGMVQKSDESAASNIDVIAYGEDYLYYTQVTTDSLGNYTLGGLSGGNYYVVAKNDFYYGSALKNEVDAQSKGIKSTPKPISDVEAFKQALLASSGQDYQSIPVKVTIVEGNLNSQDLQLSTKEIEGTVYKSDKITKENQAGVVLHDRNYSAYAYVQSDENGHYELGGLPTGDYYLFAYPSYAAYSDTLKSVSIDRVEGSLQHVTEQEALKKALNALQSSTFPSAEFKVHIEAGQLVTQDLYLTTAAIKGVVSDPSGVPIRGWVEAYGETSGSYSGSNENGEYSLGGLSTGEVVTVVAYPYYSSDAKMYFNALPKKITVTNTVQTLDLRLTTKEIQGVVKKPAPDSSAVSGMRVIVHDVNYEFYVQRYSGSDGHYELGGLPTGDYYIQALPTESNSEYFAASNESQTALGLQYVSDRDAFKKALEAAQSASSDQGCASYPVQVDITAGQLLTKDIVLSNPEVYGTVTMLNAPIGQEYTVAIVSPNNGDHTATTITKNGSYQFGGLSDGTYQVIACSPDLTKYANGIAKVNIKSTNSLKQDILLPVPAFHGTLTTPNGSLTGEDVYVYLSYYNAGILADSGYYAFGSVPNGEYQLRAYARNGYQIELTPSYTQTVKVSSGSPEKPVYDLKLTVPTLKGRVLDPKGEVVTNVKVTITDKNGSPNNTWTNYDGAFQYGGIPDGTYTLSVQVPSGKSWTAPTPVSVDIKAGQLVTNTLKFQDGKDTIAPTAVSSCPAQGATEVDLNPFITVEFSEDIQAGSAYESILLKDPAGKQVPLTKAIQGSILTLNPTTPLAFNKQYTLTVPINAVKDMSNNNLKKGYKVPFTTVKAPIVKINAEPASVAVLVGASQSVKISAVYEDDSEEDVTKDVQFESMNPDVATVTNGLITGIGKGETAVTACYNEEWSVEIPVKVTPVVLSIFAEPKDPINMILGGETEYVNPPRIFAQYAGNDGEEDVTELTTWQSSKPGIVEVLEGEEGQGVMFHALAKGTATLTATFGGKKTTVIVNVTPKIVGIEAIPSEVALTTGKQQAVKVYLDYVDESTEDVTKSTSTTWESGDPGIATVTGGSVTGVSKGDTTVTACYNEEWYVEIPVKVTPEVLSIYADPKDP
ncbi:MAG: carboxypeptidase regulatory-like domain-containing protein, partial [Desulfosporosinus sp.]